MGKKNHTVDILFIVILLGSFLLFSIALTVLGADVYKKTVSDNQEAYQTRTAALYFDEKLHQVDVKNAVALKSLDSGQQALVLTEGNYQTWIFLSAGQLKEATVKKGTSVTENFGQPVLSLSSLKFAPLKNNLLRVTSISPEGVRSQVDILLKASRLEVEK